MNRVIAIDTETYYASDYGIQENGLYGYTHNEQFDPYMISVSDGSESWAGSPKDFNWDALDGAFLLSHNAAFDRTVYEAMVEQGLAPKVNYAGWACTANMSAYLCNRRSLADSVKYLLGVEVDKSMRNYMKGKTWKQAQADGDAAQRLLEYARLDAVHCYNLWDKFSDRWPAHERALSELTINQGTRGIQVNQKLLDEYIGVAQASLQAIENSIPWLETGGKATSSKAIAEQCRKAGIPSPPVKAHEDGEEKFAWWENEYKYRYPWILAVSEWRKINKFLGTVERMKRWCRPDGTMTFSLKYFGAHCFTGDHEVLTRDGWVRLDQWGGGEIAQWDGDSLLWGPASPNKFEVDGNEKLLRLHNGYVDCTMTQGHWLATYDAKTGEQRREQAEVARHHRRKIPVSGIWNSGCVKIPSWKITLLAAVQADGHYMTDCRSIRFRFTKGRKIGRLRSALKQSGLDWSESVYPSEPRVTVFVIRQYPEWLSGRKQWGPELLSWQQESLLRLLRELVHWDGHQCGPNSTEYSTCERGNADWIATVAHLTGHAASVSIATARQKKWRDRYRVFIRPSSRVEIKPGHWSVVGPARTVYCPTAQLGACLFRHKGSIFITHQTGRWSGDSGLNMQNLRKVPIFLNPDLRETDDPDPAAHAHALDIRRLFIARPGRKMIISDLSQIEPRVLAWLGGNKELLERIAEGMSVYEVHGRQSLGWLGGNMKKEDPELYKRCKAEVLALGYGCGAEKYVDAAYVMAGYKVDPDQAVREVTQFRENNPRIVNIWRTLDAEFKRSVGGTFEMTLPSGRVMRYPEVRTETRRYRDKETGKVVPKAVYTADVGGIRKGHYGGLLTENLVQAASRDVFAHHLLLLQAHPGMDVLFTAHDEAIMEADKDVPLSAVTSIMSKAPPWLAGCPISCEAEEVEHYKK